MANGRSESVDTVIVGNGPSALILSFILHGNIPYYTGGHHDALLDRKLAVSPCLLDVVPDIYTHLQSSINYSSQALPINVLLDTLLRPNGDTEIDPQSCIEWRHDPSKALSHIVLGDAPAPGGQWADNPVTASWDIGALSYADQLSLPGYSFGEYWLTTKKTKLPDLVRPTRHDVADYLAAYPKAVRIDDSIRTHASVTSVHRSPTGFIIVPQGLHCRHLVLASGVFSINLPPPHFLRPLLNLSPSDGPVMVIGSGFTAADIIISTPPNRKIYHLYNWDPINHPSPLKGCHGSAYPEYAWVYRQMKYKADRINENSINMDKFPNKKGSSASAIASFVQRDWVATYQGFPNCRIMSTSLDADAIAESTHPQHLPAPAQHLHSAQQAPHHHSFGLRRSSLTPSIPETTGRRSSASSSHSQTVTVHIGRSSIGDTLALKITAFRYAAGRRGSLAYLSPSLLQEVLPQDLELSPAFSNDAHGHLLPTAAPRRSLSPFPHSDTRASQDLQRESIDHQLLRPESSRGSQDFRRGSSEYDFATRRGSVEYTTSLAHIPKIMITGQTIRSKMAELEDLGLLKDRTTGFEVAPNVFAIGSLTGDSLVRFAVGGCTAVAGKIIRDLGKGKGKGKGDATTGKSNGLMANHNGLHPQRPRTASTSATSGRRESNPLVGGFASYDALDGDAVPELPVIQATQGQPHHLMIPMRESRRKSIDGRAHEYYDEEVEAPPTAESEAEAYAKATKMREQQIADRRAREKEEKCCVM